MGSVGKAMQCLEMDLPLSQERAAEFLNHCTSKQWSPLFRAMDTWFAKDLEASLFFLEVLAMLVQDRLRVFAGAPSRLPSSHATGPQHISPDTCSRILESISQATRRLEERKGTVSVALQSLALQCGEAL